MYQHAFYVYMLLCRDSTFYTGITNDLERRVSEHKAGFNPGAYTFNRRPVHLVYYEVFNSFPEAERWEKRIQKWSSKKKKALIHTDFERISRYSRSKNNEVRRREISTSST